MAIANPIMQSTWLPATVIENQQWTPRLYSLRLQAELLPFKAGQFVRLQLPLPVDGLPQFIAKSYSLLNAPDDPIAEVFFNIVPNGKLSTALAQLQLGDRLEISQPANGFFVLDEVPQAAQLWMIATGTGLGPYLSILKTAQAWQRFEQIVLVHGVPLVAELAYQDLITSLLEQHPQQFQYVSCVTRENNPNGLNGRVTTNLQAGALEQVTGLSINPQDSQIMLCGNHAMLDEMKVLLAQRGLQKHLRHKPGHITTEQYF
jgi:ferredoxin--NADP+ reductase